MSTNEYTPTTADVRETWVEGQDITFGEGPSFHGAEFDRWHAKELADARREALEEAARQWSDDPADDDEKTVHDWLLRRASEIRKGGPDAEQ